jgi:hypothetical protein
VRNFYALPLQLLKLMILIKARSGDVFEGIGTHEA